MTDGADPAALNRRRTLARIVNLGSIYLLGAALAAGLLSAGAPAWAFVIAFLVPSAIFFLYDIEDKLDRMFWTQIAHSWRAHTLMRKPVHRTPVERCPPQLLAAVRRFDKHASLVMVADAGGDRIAVLDWDVWEEPDREYFYLIGVNAAGAMNAMTFFSKWPKAWGSLR